MSATQHTIRPEELLAHAAWIRRLAYKLVFDANRVDDVVQEAWLKMLKSPPAAEGNVRGWMATVVANVARSMGRSESRRKHHEAAVEGGPEAEPTDDVIARAALQRDLVGHVLKLDEPYRTVLLLRFFEELAPRQISRRTGRSVATVKTQLHRGIAILRQQLDGKYGDRRSWALMLLPLAKGGSAAGIGSSLVVTAASVALVLTGVALWRSWDSRRDSAPVRGDMVADLVDQREISAPVRPQAATPEVIAEDTRVQLPAHEESTELKTGARRSHAVRARVLDSSGALLSGVRLIWNDPRALSWEDESELTIVGKNFWLPVSPEERAALRASSTELEAFVQANFSAPEIGKALLLGQAVPALEVESGPDGVFELEVPVASEGVRSGDSRTTVVAEGTSSAFGEEERVVLVCPKTSSEGVVVTSEGVSVAEAEVAVHAYLMQLTHFPHRVQWKGKLPSWRTRTDELGRYRFPELPIGVPLWIQATKGHGWSRAKRFDPVGAPQTLVMPEAERLAPPITIVGRVLHADGTVAARATLSAPGGQTTTDEEGRFALQPTGISKDMVLVAAKPGHGAVLREGLAQELEWRQGSQTIADLVLPDGPKRIAGVVVDAAGRPQQDFEISLVNPTNLNGLRLEQFVGGRNGSVTTKADGSFMLSVLPARDYHLRVGRGEQVVWTNAVRAGMHDLEIVVDEARTWPWISGVVTDSAGEPASGIDVRVQLELRGDGVVDSVILGSTQTGPDGRFVLTDVPKGTSGALPTASVKLLLTNDEAPWSGPSSSHRITPGDAVEDLRFVLPLWCRFRLEAGVEPISAIEVLNERGEALDIYVYDGPRVMTASRLDREECFSVCHVENAAAMLVLHRENGEAQSLPIELEPGMLEVIRP